MSIKPISLHPTERRGRTCTLPNGELALDARAVATVCLVNARNPPDPKNPKVHTRARVLMTRWCEVPDYERVESLAAVIGDGYILDVCEAYIHKHGLETT